MAENKKKYDIEVVQEGFANGVAPGFPLNDKQKEHENPWYIGYGMDGPKGYSRNLDTIHKL